MKKAIAACLRWSWVVVGAAVFLAACRQPGAAEAQPDPLIRQMRHLLATKIAVGPLEKGAAVYTDREAMAEAVPDELAEYTLIAAASELRWAKREGLCFTIDRPSVVYVGYHEGIKQPPEWLTKQFEKTALKIGVHEPGTRAPHRPERRWSFDVWKRSFPAGPVILGPNKDEALPYVALLEKGVEPRSPHYGGPMADVTISAVAEGGLAYADRGYVLKDVPKELVGAKLLPMKQAYALEDGVYSGTHLRVPWVDTGGRELYPARDVEVFIAYDAGSASVPDWMTRAGFVKSDLSLKVGNMKFYDDRPMAVYSAKFKAGEKVPLGPNRGTGCSGWPLQYLAMLEAHAEDKR